MGILAKEKDYVSVLLAEENVKVAHLRVATAGTEVVNIVQRDIRAISPEDLPKTIQSVLSELSVKKPTAICIIPSNLATTKNIEIPSLDDNEIKSIINLQAGRHTPYSREEILLDYINIGIYQRNYSKILLVIVNRSVLKKQLAILENAGLKISRVLFAPEGIARFYAQGRGSPEAACPVGIIDVGHSFTDFTVEFRGTVIACRNIPIGLSHLTTEGKAAFDKLTAELKKSVESYQSEDIEKLPESYLLTHGDDKIKELQSLLKEVLNTNVKIAPFGDYVKMKPGTGKIFTNASQESFLNVIAPAVVSGELHLDLLPEDIKMQRAIEEQGRQVTKLGIFAFVIIILICAMFFIKIQFKTAILEKIKKGHEPKRKETQVLEEITARTAIVKNHFHKRLVGLNTVNELFNIIPEEIYLEYVTLEQDGKITVQGISESMSRVFVLVGTLEDSPLFKGVKTTSTTAKKERGKDVAAFELTFRLESAQDEPAAEEDKIEDTPATPASEAKPKEEGKK